MTTATIVKFPFSVARRAHARRPRISKNGTPEERAAKNGTPQNDDPIFAAIERHRQLDAAHMAACEADGADNDASDAACEAAFKALADLVAITPTTLTGCAAMLRYCHHVTAVQECNALFDGYTRVEEPAADLLLRLAARIEAAA